MSVISVEHLQKKYKTYTKEPGIGGAIHSLFSRTYSTQKAVDDISFCINEGDLVGFIGPNGAGKTTTLKCLSGLLYPTGGKVSVLGFTPFERKYQFLKHIALVMGQKNQLWWDLPAMDTFLLHKEIYAIPQKQFQETLDELITLLQVHDVLKVQVRKLSLGQRMKMELIAALIHNPKILFLDEPTIGLDVVMQKNLREFIKSYNKKFNATIVLTSHYMKDVEDICQRILMINQGKLLFDGSLRTLIQERAPYKIISLILKNAVSKKTLQSLGDIKKFSFPQVVFRVRSEKASYIAATMFKKLPIDDVTIEDPAIEDIIRDIFSQQKTTISR